MKIRTVLFLSMLVLASSLAPLVAGLTEPVLGEKVLQRALSCGSRAGHYLVSPQGVKDTAVAYGVGMGLTAMHELGHAIMAKILYGAPLDVTLGSLSTNAFVHVGFLKIAGFNPAMGYSMTPNRGVSQPFKEALIDIAGPVTGALASLGVFMLLKNYDGYYVAKSAALFGLINQSVGLAGLAGMFIPDSDISNAIAALKRRTMVFSRLDRPLASSESL